MTIRLLTLICAAVLFGAAAPPQGDLRGDWRNTKNTVHLHVQQCGATLCGIVTWAADQQRVDARNGTGTELIGSRLLRNLKRGSDGSWHGDVFIPDINKTVSATVAEVDGDTIQITGCTLFGLVCKTQHWHRFQ